MGFDLEDDWWVLLIIPLVIMIIRFFTAPPCCAALMEMECNTTCGDVKGRRVASCRGCDWYLDCRLFKRHRHCPKGELFDVRKARCRKEEDAQCGLQESKKPLVPSSSYVKAKSTSTGFLAKILKKLSNTYKAN